MMLMPGRLSEMVKKAIANDACIPCHKTLDGERAVCRGFYDRHQNDTLMCRLGSTSIYGIIEIDPDNNDDKEKT
jgi:hypothetical protein